MTRLTARARSLLLATLFLLGPAACWQPADELTGKWQLADRSETLEFLADGTVMQSDPGGPLIGGTYRRIADDRIRVSFGGPAVYAPPREYRVVRSGDRIDVTDAQGETRTYTRTD